MKRILIFAALAALLASCSQDELPTPANKDLTPLGVSSASVSAVITKGNSDIPKIGVFQVGDTYYNQTIQEYDKSNDGKWAATTPIYLNNNPSTVFGYYPLESLPTTSYSSESKITLTSQPYSTTYDLCYDLHSGLTNATPDPTVSFDMNHAYSRLIFSFDKDASYSNGVGAVSSIAINGNVYANALMDMKNNAAITEGTADYTIKGDQNTILATAGSTTANKVDLLMAPVTTTFNQDTQLTFIVDGKTMRLTLPKTLFSALQPKYQYTIKITLKGSGLLVSNVTVEDWTSVGDITGGDIN